VAGYTITITPFDDETAPQTTIRVDTSSGQARIVELSVRAPDGSGLTPGQLPAVNIDQMIAAVTPSQPAALGAAPAEAQPRQRRAAAGRRATSGTRTASGTRAKAGRSAAQAPTRSRQARSVQARAAKATEQPARTGRAYRRMPEAEELVAAYREAGGTTAVAKQYGVPRHTATGWIRRLRRLGLLETPRRR
jgi:hypothetical protein